MPQTQVHVDPATGRFLDTAGRPLDVQYVLTDVSQQVLGTRVAADPPHGLVLYKVSAPVRELTAITGWYGPPDVWTGPEVTWSRAECSGGTLRIPVFTDPALFHDVVQKIAISGTTTPQVVPLRPTQSRTLSIPLTPQHGRCVVHLTISPARVPANYPRLKLPNDTRVLGVHAQRFVYRP